MSTHVLLVSENTTGRVRRLIFDLSFIGPYPVDGELIPPAQLMLVQVDGYDISSPLPGYTFAFDRLTSRLHVYGLSSLGTATDIPVFFTEPGDPLNAPAKVPAGTGLNLSTAPQEITPGTDLSVLQHVQFTVEGF